MITFKPAVLSNVSLLIGFVSPSGGGKTYSALELATGMCGPDEKFAVIDTENERALHYANQFSFDHTDFQPPFSPDRYVEHIQAADNAGYPVIVVDSMSHEYAGEGGLLDWHEAIVNKMAGNDYSKRDKVTVAAWSKPKQSHKAMVQKILRLKAHLILCFRSEEKIEMIKDDKGKMQIVPKKSHAGLDGWVPVAERSFPYELTASLLMLPDNPGVPRGIKLQEQHRTIFPPDKKIDQESGKLLALWASGHHNRDTAPRKADSSAVNSSPSGDNPEGAAVSPDDDFISIDQAIHIEDELKESGIDRSTFLANAQIKSIPLLRAVRYDRALAWIKRHSER